MQNICKSFSTTVRKMIRVVSKIGLGGYHIIMYGNIQTLKIHPIIVCK